MTNELLKKSFWGTFWSLIESFANYFLTFIIGIILARLLSPSDFGLVGMLTVFISLSNVFIESGFSNALIRKLNRSIQDYSTAFYFNIVVGIFFYGILFFSSPYIATFFSEPLLSSLLKVLGISILANSLCVVPNAILLSSLNIKRITQINIVARIIVGIISIILAYNGFGVWTLVIQTVGFNILKSIAFWISARWKPVKSFSMESFRYLWSFGSKMLVVGIISTFFLEVYNLVLGKFSTKENLGYYSRSNQFAVLIPSIFLSVIQKIAIPTLSEFQDDKQRLKENYRKYLHLISFIIFPLMFIATAIANPLIITILSDKWYNSILIFQILCVGQAFSPLGTLNMCLLQVVNRTDYSLRLEVYKKILLSIIIIFTIKEGLIILVIGRSVYDIVATFMNFSCSKKILCYNYTEQVIDIAKYLLIAIICASIAYCTSLLFMNNLLKIFIGGLSGIISYLGITILFRVEAINILFDLKSKILKQ